MESVNFRKENERCSPLKLIGIEDDLSLEETADEKHEYYQGEVFVMAGGTIAHNRLVRNTLTAIDGFLAGKKL